MKHFHLIFTPGLLCLAIVLTPSSASGSTVLGFQKSGNMGYELAGFGQASSNVAFNGNVLLTTIPPGAFIEYAAIYTHDFSPGGGAIDVSMVDPFLTSTGVASNQFSTSQSPNPGGLAFGWEMPINPFSIVSNGVYTINVSPNGLNGNMSQVAGAALLVVYSHATLPLSTVTVMHGTELLDNQNNSIPSASVSFPESSGNTIGAGSGDLSILTFGDDIFDPPMSPNELVQFNGSTVHTGLDGNLNPNASIVTTNVTTVAGNNNNTATVTAGGDIFSWHVAVLQSTIPEPSRTLLSLLGLSIVVVRRRR